MWGDTRPKGKLFQPEPSPSLFEWFKQLKKDATTLYSNQNIIYDWRPVVPTEELSKIKDDLLRRIGLK